MPITGGIASEPTLGTALGADFLWLRRFIHSIVTWEHEKVVPYLLTLRVAIENQGWILVTHALQRDLDQTEGNEVRKMMSRS